MPIVAKRNRIKTKLKAIALMLCIAAGLTAYIFYRAFYGPSIRLSVKSRIIYIHTGWNINQVVNMLKYKHLIRNPKAFKLLAGIKDYSTHIKPGRYRVMNKMNNMQLVNLLKSGRQEPETISIRDIRTLQELAGLVSYKIEADSSVILNVLLNSKTLNKYGFTAQSFPVMFIPGTYPLLWTETPAQFIEEMHTDYEMFWTPERRRLAAAIPLTPLQVSVLASIVQAEQSVYNDEKPVIAGLYINRLKKHIPLQSDPTLIFARGDFSIMRVRQGDKEIDSPYNTYMHTGLPPGPINFPEPSSLDAVLHYQQSNYLYMCAEDDFSGRHHFSTSFKEQERYAACYREALNKRGITR